MRQINPYWHAARVAEKNEKDRLRSRKSFSRACDYLRTNHRYQLEVGGSLVSETQIMTGKEAKLTNLALQQDFCAAVAAGRPNGERLHRWVCIERDVVASGKEEA